MLMCVEELSKVCATTGVIVSAHTSLCVDPIHDITVQMHRKQNIYRIFASGKKLGAFGLTEPGAGTDAQGQQTKAVFDEATNEWVLNGSKCFITNGKEADVYVIIAVTGKIEKRGRVQKEISAFIVEKGTPGFTFGTKENKMGICASSTYELIFTDCRIPKDRRYLRRYRAKALVSLCILWMADVSVSLLRLLVSLRVLLRATIELCKGKKAVRTFHFTVPEYTVPVGRYGY